MKLTINGELRDVEGVTSVFELLQTFGIDQKILVVELNRDIIDRDLYRSTVLKEDDRIEIVHFVGGG